MPGALRGNVATLAALAGFRVVGRDRGGGAFRRWCPWAMHHFKHSLRPRIIQRRIAVVAPEVPQFDPFPACIESGRRGA